MPASLFLSDGQPMAAPGLATRAQATAKGDMLFRYGEPTSVRPTYPSMEALGQGLSISKSLPEVLASGERAMIAA